MEEDDGETEDSDSEELSSEYETAEEELDEISGMLNDTNVRDSSSEESDFLSLNASFAASTDKVSMSGSNSQSERKRRPSKKQKRNRRIARYKTSYLEEFCNLGGVYDVTDDIESVFNDIAETGSCVNIKRRVPSLVEMCLMAIRRKRTNSDIKSKKKPPQFKLTELPRKMSGQIKSWGQTQRDLERLLQYIQNQLLPLFINKSNVMVTEEKCGKCKPGEFLHLMKRSVFSELANPVWNQNTDYRFCEEYTGFLMSGSVFKSKQLDDLGFSCAEDFAICQTVLVTATAGKMPWIHTHIGLVSDLESDIF